MTEVRLVLTTVASPHEGERLARALVERRQAACVNMLPAVESIFRWQGEVSKEAETLLLIKTVRSAYEDVAATIAELHSYDLPEILSLAVDEGEGKFIEWLAGCISSD